MFVSLLLIDVFSEAYDESLDFGEDDAPASPGTQMNSPAQGVHNPQTPTRKRSNNNTPTNPHTARRLQRSMSSPMTPFQRLFRGQAQGNSRFAYATPLKMQILTEYYNFFLQTNVRVALQAKEEQQALAANVLMRRLLCELYKQTHSHNAYTFSRFNRFAHRFMRQRTQVLWRDIFRNVVRLLLVLLLLFELAGTHISTA
jgi:hypothetical protein